MASSPALNQVKFLSASFALVVATGLWSVQGFLVEPKEAIAASAGRVPASVKGGTATAEGSVQSGVQRENGLDVFDWNCKESKEQPQVQTSHLRLKSKACGKETLQVIDVKNTTNGFTATIFPAANGFTTDYIDLVEGENKIKVRLKSSKGTTLERVIRLLRKPAALEAVKNGSVH